MVQDVDSHVSHGFSHRILQTHDLSQPTHIVNPKTASSWRNIEQGVPILSPLQPKTEGVGGNVYYIALSSYTVFIIFTILFS